MFEDDNWNEEQRDCGYQPVILPLLGFASFFVLIVGLAVYVLAEALP